MNIKKFSKKTLISFWLGAVFVAGSVAFAAVTIPPACSTPGTCTDLSATFQAVVAKTSLRLTDANNSHFVALQAPAVVVSDVTLTLPDTAGNSGEILSTDGTGILSWVSAIGSFAGLSDTNVAGVVAGAMTFFDGTNWVGLPAGTTGQSLAMNTTATAPEWVSPPPTLRVFSLTPLIINARLTDELGPGNSNNFRPRVDLNSASATHYRLYDPSRLLTPNGLNLVIQNTGTYKVTIGHRGGTSFLSELSVNLDAVKLLHSSAPLVGGLRVPKAISNTTSSVIFSATAGQIVTIRQESRSDDPIGVSVVLKQLF